MTESVRNPGVELRRKVLLWAGRGTTAILDQGLFAVSNFALNIALARWLTPTEYGAFATVYAVSALLSTFHNGWLTEPLLVFGSSEPAPEQSRYLRVVLAGHWLFTIGLSIVMAAAAWLSWLFVSRVIGAALGGLAAALPFIHYRSIARTAAYMQLKPRLAAQSGGLYLVILLGSLYGFYRIAWLGTVQAFLLLGFASLASGAWLLHRLGPQRPDFADRARARAAASRHWGYGRWAASTGLLQWIPGQVYFVLLPLWAGLESTATLRALVNLIMPVNQTFAAIGVLLTSTLGRYTASPLLGRIVGTTTGAMAAAALVYWLLLGLFHEPILWLVYGGAYAEHGELVWLLGLVPLGAAGVSVFGSALRAMQRPDRLFWSYLMATITTLTLGLALAMAFGVRGAIWGLIVAAIVNGCSMGIFFSRVGRRREGPG